MMRAIVAVAWAFAATAAAQERPTYDVLIRGGTLVDGTGAPARRGDVAIRGQRIVALGDVPAGDATLVVDAVGKVVAPGFVDIHSHSEANLLEDGRGASKLTQGVTTEVFGESSSPGPYVGKARPPRVKVGDETLTWATLGDYFRLAEKRGVALNVASFVGLGNVWQCVMGDSHARPTPAQLDEMKRLVEDAMKDGAAGVSTMLAMPPGSLANRDELVELCKVAKRYGGIFVVHIRHEGVDVFDAIDEVVEIARRAGIRLEILHLKIADQRLWGRMNEVVERIQKARREGVAVTANVYPYTRGHNNLASIVPPWAHEGGTATMLRRLADASDRARIKREVKDGIPGWYNHYLAVGGDWSRMLLSGTGGYGGLTMDRVLAERTRGQTNPDLLEAFFDFLIDQGGSAPTIYEHHHEKDMRLALSQPWCGVGSDGLAHAVDGVLRRGHPHPRSFGAFPRVLGVYVRELKTLTLEEAVRKMTSLNAEKIGQTERGVLKVGAFADVVTFDAKTIGDRSTYVDPFRYSEGIDTVLVNGIRVLSAGRILDARPGVALRRPGRE